LVVRWHRFTQRVVFKTVCVLHEQQGALLEIYISYIDECDELNIFCNTLCYLFTK